MTDDTTPRVLQDIQARLATIEQHLTANTRAIGSLADSILQLRRAIESQATDIHTMALAIGEHGARLTTVENRLTGVEERLARIETHLPTTPQ